MTVGAQEPTLGTPHDRRTLCLSSALADRYEGHETLESMPSPQNMHDGGRLSIHGRRHASALCALQRRAVAQIAPHTCYVVVHCPSRCVDRCAGRTARRTRAPKVGPRRQGFRPIRTSSVRYICACNCHCLLRAVTVFKSPVFTNYIRETSDVSAVTEDRTEVVRYPSAFPCYSERRTHGA